MAVSKTFMLKMKSDAPFIQKYFNTSSCYMFKADALHWQNKELPNSILENIML